MSKHPSRHGESVSQPIITGPLGQATAELLSSAVPDGASGTVLVASAGEVVYANGFGAADREAGTPCSPDTVHCLGSITKQFTAAAVLKLAMMGRLAVTDPVAAFVGPIPADKRFMTLHHLLTHTAGLIGGLGGDYAPIGRDELISGALTSELLWPPGAKYRYSNLGYSLLAAVVELVSGTGYEQFLHEHLFTPAGMVDTGYTLPNWSPRTARDRLPGRRHPLGHTARPPLGHRRTVLEPPRQRRNLLHRV